MFYLRQKIKERWKWEQNEGTVQYADKQMKEMAGKEYANEGEGRTENRERGGMGVTDQQANGM